MLRDNQKLTGLEFLRNRYYNKSTAFTMEERHRMGITGRIPAAVETLEEQLVRCVAQLRTFDEPLNRYKFLRALQDKNTVLYYALLLQHLAEILPVIYTPTVGDACLHFSRVYAEEFGVYISAHEKGNIRNILRQTQKMEVNVVVITDGSRILGLGDLGANGMGIPIGKCSLYVAGAGLDPRKVLPITLDVGTNNQQLLDDTRYLGLRQPRVGDAVFYQLLDEFMRSMKEVFPKAVVQFEDFSNDHCFDILSRYRDEYRCFNDDIQGTGAVIAAGFYNAVRLTKVPATEHRIVVLGAGSAAVGVVESIAQLMIVKYNMTRDEVIKHVYLVDTKGLVTDTRGDKLAAHKVALARTDIAAEDNAKYTTLHDVVKLVKPTALIGLAAAGPAFTEDIVKFMASYCERPIIFPLSNPTSKAEINSEQAYSWTNGKAIVASGSPFPATVVNGKTLKPSQGNNMYIFPGVGLGCSLSQCSAIPDDLMTRSASALADMVDEKDLEAGLYPPLPEIRRVSTVIAAAVISYVQNNADIVSDAAKALPTDMMELRAAATEAMWTATYEDSDFYAKHL